MDSGGRFELAWHLTPELPFRQKGRWRNFTNLPPVGHTGGSPFTCNSDASLLPPNPTGRSKKPLALQIMNGRHIVDSVLEQIIQKMTNAQITSRLVSMGVPETDAGKVIECVRIGFKAGTASVVTGGMSDQGIRLGENPIFDLAFKRGKAAMRFTTPAWVLIRIIWPNLLGIGLLIAAIAWWKLK